MNSRIERVVPSAVSLLVLVSAWVARRGGVLPAAAEVERVATGFGWTEGPAYDGFGGLWFVDMVSPFPSSQRKSILRYDIARGRTDRIVSDSGGANGLAFDELGRLIATEVDSKRLTRRTLFGKKVLASSYGGKSLNGPNDLVLDSNGGIYFTDPNLFDFGLGRRDAVYYLPPSGNLRLVTTEVDDPNGIALSPDGATLYLAAQTEGRIYAYDVRNPGEIRNRRVFATGFLPDGLTVDHEGNVYTALVVDSEVAVWNPAGQELFRLDIPEWTSNVTLAGPDRDVLYITASTSLYRMPLAFSTASATFSASAHSVPEPASLAWAFSAVLILLCRRRKSLAS